MAKILFRLAYGNLQRHYLPKDYIEVAIAKTYYDGIVRVMQKCGWINWNRQTTLRKHCAFLPKTYAVVLHENKVVGTCGALHGTDKDYKIMEPYSARIDSVAVMRNHRNTGIAKAVVSDVVLRLYEMGYKTIWVETDDYRKAAQHVYKAVGFRVYRND